MKKKVTIFIALLLLIQFAVSQDTSTYIIEIVEPPRFEYRGGLLLGDTIKVDFNILDRHSKQRDLYIDDKEEVTLETRERIGNRYLHATPEYIPGSLRNMRERAGRGHIPDAITVSLLIDRSRQIHPQHMKSIQNAVSSFVEQLPDGSVYYSYFHQHVSSSMPVNRQNIHEANFDSSTFPPDLYNAVQMKIMEFDSTATIPNAQPQAASYPNYEVNRDLARSDPNHRYLVILATGVDDAENIFKYLSADSDYKRVTEIDLHQSLRQHRDEVTVFVLGFGDDPERSDFDEAGLKAIATAAGNPGGYFRAEPDSVIERFHLVLDEISGDYQALFASPANMVYAGEQRTLSLEIKSPIQAEGEITYQIGSPTRPLQTGAVDKGRQVLWGILGGLITFIVIIIMLQLIWPLIKNRIFSMNYVARYRPASEELKKICPYCFEHFEAGDKLIIKCEHFVHKACWHENGHMCPEYGQNCTQGKQDYFDVSDPLSRKNKLFYLNWVLFGLLGGFLSWLVYVLVMDKTPFDGFSRALILWLGKEENIDGITLFTLKIAPLFTIGILKGFFLSLLFAHIEEYRRRSFLVVLKILLRGIVGGIVGFVSFVLGSVILILFNLEHTNVLVDWIPWLFFGGLIGYSLTVKTTLSWKHGLLGGLISIVFSFIVLYAQLSPDFQVVWLLVAFMLYGAGLGASIATVRSTAEHYFLKILNGPKEGNQIAIHKWMNVQGGLNEIYIGTSNVCEVQINWEKTQTVAEKHAKLYINRERKMPVIVSVQKDKNTQYDERVDMQVGREYDLFNGTTFTIGSTAFQYIEKE